MKFEILDKPIMVTDCFPVKNTENLHRRHIFYYILFPGCKCIGRNKKIKKCPLGTLDHGLEPEHKYIYANKLYIY